MIKVYPIFLITRILLGLIFIIASIDKIIDPADLLEIYQITILFHLALRILLLSYFHG